MPPPYSREQRLMIHSLSHLFMEGSFWEIAKRMVLQKWESEGFYKTFGGISHFDPDKTKLSRFQKRLHDLFFECSEREKRFFSQAKLLRNEALALNVPYGEIMERGFWRALKTSTPRFNRFFSGFLVQIEYDDMRKPATKKELIAKLNREIAQSSQREANATWRAIESLTASSQSSASPLTAKKGLSLRKISRKKR